MLKKPFILEVSACMTEVKSKPRFVRTPKGAQKCPYEWGVRIKRVMLLKSKNPFHYIGGKCGMTEVLSNKSVPTNGVSVLSRSCY